MNNALVISNKKILNNTLTELHNFVNEELNMYDKYIENIILKRNENGIIENNLISKCLSEYPELISLHKDLYKISLERNKLYEYFYKYKELYQDDKDLLKEINSFIFEANFDFSKKLKPLKIIISQLNRHFWFDLSPFDELDLIVAFFNKLGFDYTKFNLYSSQKELNIISGLTHKISDIHSELTTHKIISEIEDFETPVVNLSLDCFNYKLTQEIKYGWTKIISKKDQIKKNDKSNGLYMVNFNILYKKDGSNQTSDTLVYSYINYNTMFNSLLVNFMEQTTNVNIKTNNINATIFVVDSELQKYSNWDLNTFINFFEKNLENLGNKDLKYNIIEYLLLLSFFGPIYSNMDTHSNILHSLFYGELSKLFEAYSTYNKSQSTEEVMKKFNFKPELTKNYNKNIIFNFVFLVKNLDSLLDKLKDLNVNEGPQKTRGKCSFLDANLCRIDTAFRKSMYFSNKSLNSPLTGKYFSFKNIHQNLGNVRW